MAALEELRDPFQTLDPAVWQFTSGTWTSIGTGGRLQTLSIYEDPVALAAGSVRAGGEVWSVASWDLRGSQATVELWGFDVTASGRTHVALFTDGSHRNAVAWEVGYDSSSVWGWVLRAIRTVAGVRTTVATVRPDTQEARYLRLSETAGTVSWSYSPDGFTWTTAGAWAPSFSVAAVRVALGSWYESPGDSGGGRGLFDNLNILVGAADPVTITGDDGQPYLALDVQPDNVTGVVRLGTSVIGGPDRLAWSTDDPSTWVNVVCDVRSVSYQRGANRALGVLTTTEAGLVTVVVEDPAGQFDPNQNGESIRKATPVRLRAWGTDVLGARWDAVLFTGELDEAQARYLPDETVPVVTLTVVDIIGPLSAWESEGLDGDGAGAGDNLLQRARRILATVGRGEVSSASSPAYTASLAPTTLQQAWTELQAATLAELGRLWVDRHNRLQLRARGSQPSGPVRGTLSDVHGEATVGVHGCMADASIVRGPEGMANRAIGRRVKLSTDVTDPVQQRREDEVSQRLYGVAAVNRQGLLLQTDEQVAAWAGALIVARTKPELRVEEVTPAPPPADLDAALEQWPAVLSTDIGDRWVFRYRPPAGPPIFRGVAVLGIQAVLTPEAWTITWTTEAAPVPGASNPLGWFIIGTSVLGGSDLLAPYSAPYSTL